jgi:hypothetical protein
VTQIRTKSVYFQILCVTLTRWSQSVSMRVNGHYGYTMGNWVYHVSEWWLFSFSLTHHIHTHITHEYWQIVKLMSLWGSGKIFVCYHMWWGEHLRSQSLKKPVQDCLESQTWSWVLIENGSRKDVQQRRERQEKRERTARTWGEGERVTREKKGDTHVDCWVITWEINLNPNQSPLIIRIVLIGRKVYQHADLRQISSEEFVRSDKTSSTSAFCAELFFWTIFGGVTVIMINSFIQTLQAHFTRSSVWGFKLVVYEVLSSRLTSH